MEDEKGKPTKQTVIFIQKQSNSMFGLFREYPGIRCMHEHNPDDVRHNLCRGLREFHKEANDGITVSMVEWDESNLEAAEREHLTVLP